MLWDCRGNENAHWLSANIKEVLLTSWFVIMVLIIRFFLRSINLLDTHGERFMSERKKGSIEVKTYV